MRGTVLRGRVDDRRARIGQRVAVLLLPETASKQGRQGLFALHGFVRLARSRSFTPRCELLTCCSQCCVDNLPLTQPVGVSFSPHFVPDSNLRTAALCRREPSICIIMSARQETYSICHSVQGWVVRTEGGRHYSGPHE